MICWTVQAVPTCASNCSSVVNTYWSGDSAVGTLINLALPLLIPPPSVGDVLMIIQMQGGSIDNSNNNNYGAGTGSGRGHTDIGKAGQYEFASVKLAASQVNPQAVTLDAPLKFEYSSSMNNRFQVIKVPLCRFATVNSPVVPRWNGSVGGVLALIADRVRLGNVNMRGIGFRGGPEIPFTSQSSTLNDDFGNDENNYRDATTVTMRNSDDQYNGPKGEGFIGVARYPLYTSTFVQRAYTNTTYPGGFDCGRGAPGNAGGGGNWVDSGAGGGGNGGRGADGKISTFTFSLNNNPPGRGGSSAPSNAINRLFLGTILLPCCVSPSLTSLRWRRRGSTPE